MLGPRCPLRTKITFPLRHPFCHILSPGVVGRCAYRCDFSQAVYVLMEMWFLGCCCCFFLPKCYFILDLEILRKHLQSLLMGKIWCAWGLDAILMSFLERYGGKKWGIVKSNQQPQCLITPTWLEARGSSHTFH